MNIKTTIILPSSIDIQKILNVFGRITGERLLLMLSYVYTTGHWKYDVKSARFDVSTDILQKLGGNKVIDLKKFKHIEVRKKNGKNKGKVLDKVNQYVLLLDWAVSQGIIQRSESYEIGKHSKEIRFCDYDTIFYSQQEYVLTAKNAIKAFQSLQKELEDQFCGSNFEGRKEVYLKIHRSVKGLKYDSAGAYAFIKKNEDKGAFYYHYYIKNGFECWKIDPQGRVYTMPVIIPKRLRKFLSFDGKPLYQFDVSHCQPLLHSLLYKTFFKDDTEEYKRYMVLCEQGQFYDYLNNKLPTKVNIDDEAVRSAFKERVFQEVYYGHPTSKGTLTSDLNSVLQKEFPILHSIMKEVKTPNHRMLSKTMQSIEADIIMDGIVQELRNETFPIITIHDAILTTEEGLVKVDAAMKKAFIDLQMNPTIKQTKI